MLSEQLIPFAGTDWAMWRWFALRGAGFPVAHVLQLAMPACAEAVDHLLACEAEVEQARRNSQALLFAEARTVEGEAQKLLIKVARRVQRGKQLDVLPTAPLSSQAIALLNTLAATSRRRDQARTDLNDLYHKAIIQTMHTLAAVAEDEDFLEAVTWQNRRAVHDGFAPFLRHAFTEKPSHSQREHARLIARYLQRYCTKNDSIGFFGPIGWGRWRSDITEMTVRPGASLLDARTVYFETWGIDVLAQKLSEQPGLLPWAIPRPMPFLSLQGTTLHIPFARPFELSVAQAAVLATCDGQRTARDIARVLLRRSLSGLENEADVFAILEELRNARRITWAFEVSMADWHPEQALRLQIEHITPPVLRQEALRPLELLEERRAAVAAAANVEELDRALQHLETTFTHLTASSPTRDAGKTYAARTLVYEECRRNIELTPGSALLQSLAPPLTLLLTSARWFTYTAARFYRRAFKKKYDELVQKTGSSTLDFATYWSWVQELFPVVPGQLLNKTLLPEFQKRWAAILRIPDGQHHIHYSSKELQPRVQKLFEAPQSGWLSTCYHSPDVLLAACGPDAIAQGNYEWILGELHQGTNTLDRMALVSQHPKPDDLLLALAADHPEPRVVPVYPRHTLTAKRTHPTLVLPHDWYLVFGADSAHVPPERALPLSSLVLETCEGEPVVRTRDRSKQFDLLEIFKDLISSQVCNAFKLLASATHTPRITIDRLIIYRETWCFALADLTWALSTDPLEDYICCRRWAKMQSIPRFFFVRTPQESKPFYVDLDSPIYVDILAKAVRRAISASDGSITITEMYPHPEQVWLPDADGKHYTCELRLVVVDQVVPIGVQKRPSRD